jgi:hypothetical protein
MVGELVAQPPPTAQRQAQLKFRLFLALLTFEDPAERKRVFEEEIVPRVPPELIQELKRQTEERRRHWREFLDEHRGGPGGPGGRDWPGGRGGPGGWGNPGEGRGEPGPGDGSGRGFGRGPFRHPASRPPASSPGPSGAVATAQPSAAP